MVDEVVGEQGGSLASGFCMHRKEDGRGDRGGAGVGKGSAAGRTADPIPAPGLRRPASSEGELSLEMRCSVRGVILRARGESAVTAWGARAAAEAEE